MSGARREYEVYLRGVTVGITGDAFGTVAAYRSGVWHDPLIASFPTPQDSFKNDFGILEDGTVTVELADDFSRAMSGESDLLLDDGSYLLLDDGTNLLTD